MPGGGRGTRLLALALLLGAFVPRPLRRSGAEAHLHRDHDPEQRYARRRLLGVGGGSGGGGGGERAERFEHNDPTPETPHLPRHEREWHAPIGLKSSTRPRSLHGPGAPEGVRQRALLEQAYGRAKIQRYLERKGDIRLLDAGRERLRRAIAVAEHFASLRVIAQETQLLHVLAEAVYALDSRHMRVGRERVYHAHDLFEALEPRQPQLMRLDGAWTDLGDSCVVGADCGRYSECVRRRCQPPRFPRPMRVFTEQIQQQLKRRVMQHISDNGMDKHDHAARFWGGGGAVLNATDESIAAHVQLHMHAGAADPLLGQDAAVVREMLATAIGGPVEPAHIDGLRTQPAQGSLEFDVHGGAGVAATNESARAGGLAGLGRASLAGFDPTDIEFQRPIAGACSRLELHHECCQGRDNRTGRLNGLRVRDEPCQIVMRQSGEWECQPTMWVTYHLRKAMHEDVVVVGCNATEDVPHITRHVGHRRRRLQQKKQKEAHHPVRYRVAHNYAIEDDRVPGGHTGKTHPESVPHWHRWDSRHKAGEACDRDEHCIGYTCNTMGFKRGGEDDDHVSWCELRIRHTSAGYDGHHRGRHAYGHISFLKRYEGDTSEVAQILAEEDYTEHYVDNYNYTDGGGGGGGGGATARGRGVGAAGDGGVLPGSGAGGLGTESATMGALIGMLQRAQNLPQDDAAAAPPLHAAERTAAQQ